MIAITVLNNAYFEKKKKIIKKILNEKNFDKFDFIGTNLVNIYPYLYILLIFFPFLIHENQR